MMYISVGVHDDQYSTLAREQAGRSWTQVQTGDADTRASADMVFV